jgi:aminoglycoside 6'-N-acetyltransferase I
MRQAVYSGLDDEHHRQEMDMILESAAMAAFIGVSRIDDQCIGLLELSLRNIVDGCLGSPVGYIEALYIKPEFRGRGLGRQFVTFADSWFMSSGCREAATDSELDNRAAQEFFRRVGFVETWRIVEFKKTIGS